MHIYVTLNFQRRAADVMIMQENWWLTIYRVHNNLSLVQFDGVPSEELLRKYWQFEC